MVRWTLILLLCCAAPLPAAPKVVVILDDSGSMLDQFRANRRLAKIDVAKTALLTVLGQLPEDTQVGVICLNSAPRNDGWLIPFGPVDGAVVRDRLASIRANGGTPLGQYLKVGADALLAERAKSPYGMFRLLVVTDGEATDHQLVESILPEIRGRGLEIDVIGVDMQNDHSLATRVNRYRRADDQDSLVQAMQASLAESGPLTDDAHAESDFELLQGLPEEVAVAAIEAFSARDDRPIDSVAMIDGPSASPPIFNPSSPSSPHPQSPSAPQQRDRGMGLTVMIAMLILFGMLSTLIRALRRR